MDAGNANINLCLQVLPLPLSPALQWKETSCFHVLLVLFLFGTSLLFHVQFYLLLPDLHTGLSRGRSGVCIFTAFTRGFHGGIHRTSMQSKGRPILPSTLKTLILCCQCPGLIPAPQLEESAAGDKITPNSYL